MPQPYKGQSISTGPKVVQQRPDAAVGLAIVTADWVQIEQDLVLLYGFLLSRWAGQTPTDGFLPTHPVGRLTFVSLSSLSDKIALVDNVANWNLRKDNINELEKIMSSIKKLYEERNAVVSWAGGCLVCDKIFFFKRSFPHNNNLLKIISHF